MRSLFFLGFPRAGAGALARGLRPAGYDLGRDLPPAGSASAADAAVPRGLAKLDEELLARADPRAALLPGRRWLLTRGPAQPVDPEPAQTAPMLAQLARKPFALWDPRLVWTLPAWRSLVPSAGCVCVFRDPREAVAALLEAGSRDPLFAGEPLDPDLLLAAWTHAYRNVVESLSGAGDWLFVHREQILREDLHGAGARERLAAFAEAPLDLRALIPELAREQPSTAPGGEAGELYAELCARAAFVPAPSGSSHGASPVATCSTALSMDAPRPEVACVIAVREGQQAAARASVSSLLAQRGVAHEVLVVDQTLAGDLDFAGARVLRERSPSRGRAYRAALAATRAPWIAWQEPGARALPQRLARLLASARSHPGVELWTSDLRIVAGDGQGPRIEPVEQRGTPIGGWSSTVLVRRERLARIDARAFTPAELEHLQDARAAGCAGHVAEALVELEPELCAALGERARQDAALLELDAGPHAQTPELTVLLACHDRQDVILDCLEGFARQLVPPGTLELVVVDDGSSDASPELTEALELSVPLTLLRQRNAGAAAARNRGLEHLRAPLALLVNDDTVPFPDTVARHLAAHRELRDPRAIVLGTFEQPPRELRNALVRLLERTAFVFGYAEHEPGGTLSGEHFYTCNVSLASAALREVGGFDEDLACYGEDTELGLRLEAAGYSLHYRPEARALHRHVPSFDGMRWRQRAVARAHVRLFERHPHTLFPALCGATRESLADLERRVGPHTAEIEAAARSLAGVDLAALEALGGEAGKTVEHLERSLGSIFERLNNYWWSLGSADGLVEQGLSGFPELLARRPLALPDMPRTFALLLADRGGDWVRAAERWLEVELERGVEQPALCVAVPDAGARAEAVGRGLAALAARVARRGCRPRLARVPVPEGPSCARIFGAAGLWLPTSADGEPERELAAFAGVPALDLDQDPTPPDPLGAVRELVVVAPVDALVETAFGELFEACSPLVGRGDVSLVLLHPPGAAPRALLVQSVLTAALAGAEGAVPRVHVQEQRSAVLAQLARRTDLVLGLGQGAPAELDRLPLAPGREGLVRALDALDAAARLIPVLLAEEPLHA